ncbi:hypothetical protein EJB05_28976, partial [Eragrostis curvula]
LPRRTAPPHPAEPPEPGLVAGAEVALSSPSYAFYPPNFCLLPVQYIFRRDLRWCPTFTKLKTLLLNDYWCYPVDCRALACILEHTPVLEKLTVLFSSQVESKYKLEMKGRLDPKERSVGISERLQVVEIKCEAVN